MRINNNNKKKHRILQFQSNDRHTLGMLVGFSNPESNFRRVTWRDVNQGDNKACWRERGLGVYSASHDHVAPRIPTGLLQDTPVWDCLFEETVKSDQSVTVTPGHVIRF